MSDTASAKPMTLFDAIGELGWFSWVLALVVGGPSALSILQSVFVNHELVPALQWIVDSYNGLLSVLGAMVEPLIQPVLDWIGARLGVELHLYPHWRPLFGLGMIFAISLARSHWREGDHGNALRYGSTFGVCVALGSLAAGVAPLSGGWWTQGLMAFAPLATFMVWVMLQNVIDEPLKMDWTMAAILLAFSCAGFVVAAALSLLPVFSHGAGILVFGGVLFAFAVALVLTGLRTEDSGNIKFGLTMLSGFVAAGLVLIADAALKANAA